MQETKSIVRIVGWFVLMMLVGMRAVAAPATASTHADGIARRAPGNAVATSSDAYVTSMFDVGDGLPQSSIKDILQSRDGYLWIATQEGLARFDGLKFTVYTTRNAPGLVSNNLHQIVEDGSGDLWLLAGSGVTRYHRGSFENLTPDCDRTGDRINYLFRGFDHKVYAVSDSQLLRGDPTGFVPLATTKGFLTRGPWYFAQQPDGTVWVSGAGRRLMSIQGSAVHRYIAPGKGDIGGLAVDKAGSLWIASSGLWWLAPDGGFKHLDGSQWSQQHIDAMAIANDGILWFTVGGLVFSYVPGSGAAPKAWAKPSGGVRWTSFDKDGTVWQLVQNGGHDVIWSLQNGQVARLNVPAQVTTEWTLPVRKSSEGVIWVGTYHGLARFRKGRCRTYDADAGLPDGEVTEAYQTREGVIWVDAAGPTFGMIKDGKFIPSADPNLRRADVSSIAEDGDCTLWVSTFSNHLWKSVNGAPAIDCRSEIDPVNPEVAITALARGLDGSLWCASTHRLIKVVHGHPVASYPLETEAALSDHVYVICPARDGRVWLGGEKGFACLDHGKMRYFGTETGIPSVPVIDICEDHTGKIWLAFWGGGLARYANGRISTGNLGDGLYSDSIQSVIEGTHDDLWMGTSSGIFSVDRSELDRFLDSNRKHTTFSCRVYGNEDGALALQCEAGRQPVAFRAVNGDIWFACRTGMVQVSANAPAFTRDGALPVLIEKAAIDGREYSPGFVATAPPGAGDLEFDYTGITFHDADKVTFKYRLEGFDRGWVDAGERRVAYYTHVPPGDYRFQVTACDAFGNCNAVGSDFRFSIKPHFYETMWFRVLCGIVLLLATFGAGMARSYRLQQQNRLLEQKVQERTRDLELANRELSYSREEVVAQNEMLQQIQAELEAQNQELEDSRSLLASQNEQLHEMKVILELKNESLAEANARLEDLATIDGLTGLKNHRSFQVKLDTEIKFAARHNTALSLIILDVDSFKSYNDTYGHPAGDEVLRQVARLLSETARDTDFVARYGGEEFVIVLPVTDSEGAVGVADRMRASIEEWPWTVRKITASFGVATLTPDTENTADLVDRADQALYHSKHNGKNRVTMYSALKRPSIVA
jgi:diguanylate cyclase (GGDEF)-like protein